MSEAELADKITQAIKARQFPLALTLLYEHNHPIIWELFPKLAKPDQLAKPGVNFPLSDKYIGKLQSYISNHIFSYSVTLFGLSIFILAGMGLGIFGLLQLIRVLPFTLAAPAYCCVGFMAVPFLVMVISGSRDLLADDYGLLNRFSPENTQISEAEPPVND